MEQWEQLKSFLDYSLLNVSLGRILLAVFLFFTVFFLRHIFTRIGIKILRKLTGKTKTTMDDKIIDVIEPPVSFLFIVAGIWLFCRALKLPEGPMQFAGSIIRSMTVIAVIWTAYRATDIITGFFTKIARKTENELDDQIVQFSGKFLRAAIIIIGVMIIVREWGYDIAGLVAGLGIGGLAFALAAKDTVANLFGSITILLDKPFVIGDWIETPQLEGTVEDIRLRSTQIRTFSNAVTSVPNSVIANSPVTNWSRMKKRRIKYNLGVTYSSTGAQMEDCVKQIRDMLEKHPEIDNDVIFVRFTDFGESALEIFLYFFTKTTVWGEYLRVREDVNLRIMKIVENLGMNTAFPSQSLYIEKYDFSPETNKKNRQ